MENIPPDAVNGISGSSLDTLPVFHSTSADNEKGNEHSRIGKTFSPGTNRMAPLQGKKIFMHYEPGTNANKRVEGVLRRLKAELVDFFSRDINYVITNRSLNRPSASPVHTLSSSSCSPSQISPNNNTLKPQSTIGNSISKHSDDLKTPKLRGSKPSTPSVTRGRAMLMAARKSTPTSGIIQRDDSPSEALPSSILRQIQPKNSSLTPTEHGTNLNSPAPRLSLNSTTLNRPTELKHHPNDLLVRARQLGIKILTVDMVVKWIMNLPSDVQSYIESAQRTDSDELCADVTEDPERDRICQVRQLKPPCIKVIDLKSRSRPLYLDHTDYLPALWSLHTRPRLKSFVASDSTEVTTGNNTPVCSGSVPAASLGCGPPQHAASQLPPQGGLGTTTPSVLSRQNSRNKRKERLIKRSGKSGHPIQRSASVSGKLFDASRPKAVAEDEPSGYCECCTVNFKNLLEHLTCEDHQQFARNSENYRLLDDVLNKLPSIQAFLAEERDVLKRHSEKNQSARRQNKTVRSRQSSGPKGVATTTTTTNNSTTTHRKSPALSQPLEAPTEERSAHFRNSPASLLAEQPTAICPPPLNIPNVLVVEGDFSGAGQKQLFSDEDSNEICGPLVVDPAIEDALRMVTHTTAADTQETETCNNPLQPLEPGLLSVPEEVLVDIDESPKPVDVVGNAVEPRLFCSSDLSMVVQCPVKSSKEPLDPRLLEAWHAVCNDFYVKEQLSQCDIRSSKPTLSSPSDSPILENFHRACPTCLRSHIPCTIPTQLQLQLHSLVGPGHMVDVFGCTGYVSSFVCSEHTTSTESPCSAHEEEPETNASPIPQLQNTAVSIANERYTPPPCSPVFDCVNDSTDNEATDSTVPFLAPETPSSPPSSINRLSCGLQHAPPFCMMSPPVLKLSAAVSNRYKPDFPSSITDELRLDKPLQNVSTPIASPYHRPLPHDAYSDDSISSFSLSPASNTRSDSACYRRSNEWKLNSTSFECTLPTDSQSTTRLCNVNNHSRLTQSKENKSKKRSSRRRKEQYHSLSEVKTLSNLPVVKRPKLTTKSSVFSLSNHSTTFASKTAVNRTTLRKPTRSAHKKRSKHEPLISNITPDRSLGPRLAAKVAREAISLSVRALFSPSDMDRCFEARHPVICAARLSTTGALPTTPPRFRTKHNDQTPSRRWGLGVPRNGEIFPPRSHSRTLFSERIAS